MKRIPVVAALALLMVGYLAFRVTRDVQAYSDPCFSGCSAALDYISTKAAACASSPYAMNFTSWCTMDSGGSPNGGYGYQCTPICYPGNCYGPPSQCCPGGQNAFGGGGVIHDYCTP